MVEFHSTAELPGRPSKLASGKHLPHKFTPQIGKRKLSKNVPSAITPDINHFQHATPGPCAQGSHLPNHARTRRITSQPAIRVLLKARPETPQSDLVQPRPSFSILSLAFPEPHINYPTTAHATPHDSGLAEQQYDVPRLHRKEPPQLTVRDALAERFVKLRLPGTTHTPLAPAQVPASRSTTNFSFSFQHSNSVKTAKSAWSRMAISNPLLPSSRGQPNPDTKQMDAKHRRKGDNSTDPIVIDDDSDDGLNFDPSRDGRNFENTNFSQSAGWSRQLMNRRRSRPDRLDQSPSKSCISCGGILTPDSSENSESELSAPISDYIGAALHRRDVNPDREAQEEEDRQLAQLLQDGMYLTTPSQLAETSRSSASQATSPETGRLDSLRQAITHIGTRENPINLNSNVDEGTHLRRRDCVVCDDSIAVGDLPSLADCEHQPETCADCYSDWLTAQLQGSSWREAKCPGNDCNVVLSYQDIQLYADSETFQKYDTFKTRALISEDPDFRWCQVSGCDSGQIHMSGPAGNIFTCFACGSKACIVHGNTWHEGETCAEFDYRSSGRKQRDQKAQEEESLKEIKKLTKKCPGPGCNWNIEKDDGCDHMTCTQCRFEFCWICLCDYNKVKQISNVIHAKTCPYHPSRLP